jgi:hypothetical protein
MCRRCKTVFATTSSDPITVHSLGRIERVLSERKCPKCGGMVIWFSDDGIPLSYKHRVADMRRKLGVAVFWAAIAALILLLWKRYGQ